MSDVRVTPHRASGTVRPPASKSYTHRALVVGHLSGRTFRVVRPLDSADTRATADGIAALGTAVRRSRSAWIVRPARDARPNRPVSIDCGESGTTLRFLTAVAALSKRETTLRTRGELSRRPMDELLDVLRDLGAECGRDPRNGSVMVRGPIHSGEVRLPASTSSQFASALLLSLPILPGTSVVRRTGPVVSAPYVDATVAVLRHHGVRVERVGQDFRIPGGQHFQRSQFRPPGDASSAAYLWAAAATTDGCVEVRGVDPEWPQADLAVLPLLRSTGARVTRSRSGTTVRGRAVRPFDVDLTDAPDLYPLAGALAATIPGCSTIRGAAHVAWKESNRKLATARLARAFGARVRSNSLGLAIEGHRPPRAARLTGLSDHRLVMSAAVAALGASGRSTIGDARAVGKSFPGFWKVLGEVAA